MKKNTYKNPMKKLIIFFFIFFSISPPVFFFAMNILKLQLLCAFPPN